MTSIPTIGLTKAYNSIKNETDAEVEWGNKKEHKLKVEHLNDNTKVFTYIHYGTVVVDVVVYSTEKVVPFLLGGYSDTDRNYVNGLMKLCGVKGYKATTKGGNLRIKRVG